MRCFLKGEIHMGKRGILIIGILGFVLGSAWLVHLVQPQAVKEASPQIILADGAARAAFLQEQGLNEPVCIATETVRLPVSTNEAYQEYVALQEKQALPLAQHFGETATRYTYAQDGAGQDMCRAELLLDENQVLIGALWYDLTSRELQQLLTIG